MKYVALLRGIMPTNPNMRNAKLRKAFKTLGFKKVETLISSGNVLFESNSKSRDILEDKIEKGIAKLLKFESFAFVRSESDLARLVRRDPFKGLKPKMRFYWVVTFLKHRPYEIPKVIDRKKNKTPEFMRKIEKEFGKQVTTRTWQTVGRIVKKMEK